ncbi:carboxymuconolactone decarboxylase family protein [Methylopila turkensis]|nr:carboxymuconolactone decarboxylase family protein [Methylopila turkensis]
MTESRPLLPLVSDAEADPRAQAVFDDIRAVRKTDRVNNFWRALANDPDGLERTWAEVKAVMGEGALDPLVKELVYIAVSVTNGCEYCIRSHSAAARAKGLDDAGLAELFAVIALANKTNALVTGLRPPVDEAFR